MLTYLVQTNGNQGVDLTVWEADGSSETWAQFVSQNETSVEAPVIAGRWYLHHDVVHECRARIRVENVVYGNGDNRRSRSRRDSLCCIFSGRVRTNPLRPFDFGSRRRRQCSTCRRRPSLSRRLNSRRSRLGWCSESVLENPQECIDFLGWTCRYFQADRAGQWHVVGDSDVPSRDSRARWISR